MGKNEIQTQNATLELFKNAGINQTGFENMTSDDFSIPFLKIVNSNSGEKRVKEGLKDGDFLETASLEAFGSSVDVIVLKKQNYYVEWGGNGLGDFQGLHYTLDGLEYSTSDFQLQLKNGNKLSLTHSYLVLLADAPELGAMMFNVSSTGIKYSQRWMSLTRRQLDHIGNVKPLFSMVYNLKSMLNSNNNGSWYTIGQKSVSGVSAVGDISEQQAQYVIKNLSMLDKVDIKKSFESTTTVDSEEF